MGFAWEIDGKLRFFVFTVLVFGLSTAPFLFTKLIRVLIKHWRSLAIRIFAVIDDILGGGRSFNDAVAISNFVKSQLEESGFVINTEKSHSVPTQQGEHLGYLVDLKRGLFKVLQCRRDTFVYQTIGSRENSLANSESTGQLGRGDNFYVFRSWSSG